MTVFAALSLILVIALLKHRIVAPLVLGTVLGVSVAPAQIVVEDWSCGQAATISNSSPAIVTCDTPHNLPPTTAAGQQWIMDLSGAVGSWAAVNGRQVISIVDNKRFSIPVDTTHFGAFAGQSVSLVRANHDALDLTRPLSHLNAGRILPDGVYEVSTPTKYTSTSNYLYCHGYNIETFSVSHGIATVVTEKPLPSDFNYDVKPGREVHFRNFADEALNSLAYTGHGVDHPHYVSTIDSSRKIVTISTPEAQDGGDSSFPGYANRPRQLYVCPLLTPDFIFHPRQYGNGYPYPAGRVSNYVKTPPVPASTNRMYLWIQWGKNVARRADGGSVFDVGTYAKAPDDPDPRAERFHFYHQFDFDYYAGRWMRIIVNDKPQHQRAEVGTAGIPYQPMRNGWPYYSSPSWDHREADYLPNLTYFYLQPNFTFADLSEQNMLLGPITMDTVKGEPDAYVSSVSVVWSPNRFGDKGPGYEVAFATPKDSTDSYEVRYSTAGDLKSIGFSAGTTGGVVDGRKSAYTGVIWYSPDMNEQPAIWFGIRPRMSILGVSRKGVSPIVITTRAQPVMDNGDKVTITGVKGCKAANVKASPISNRPAPLWQLKYGLDHITVANGIATVYLKQPSNLVPGQVVEIYGSTNAVLGGSQPYVFYTVQNTPTPDTFTFNAPGVPDGLYNGNKSKVELLSVRVLPSFSVEGTSDGDYGGGSCSAAKLCTGGGSVVSAEDQKDFSEVYMYPFTPGGSSSEAAKEGKPKIPVPIISHPQSRPRTKR